MSKYLIRLLAMNSCHTVNGRMNVINETLETWIIVGKENWFIYSTLRYFVYNHFFSIWSTLVGKAQRRISSHALQTLYCRNKLAINGAGHPADRPYRSLA
jgi:hypothetical protein